ncbi:MAG: undecaprenyl-phosphate glucose phosphotransferase [Bacteroidota bacterium]
MESRYLYLLRFTLALTDIILINFCFFLGFYLTNKYYRPIDPSTYKSNVIVCNLIWVICTGLMRMYTLSTINSIEAIFKGTWRSVALHICLFLGYMFFTNNFNFPKGFFVSFYVLTIVSFILSRFTGTAFQNLLSKNFELRKSVAVMGMNSGGVRLAEYLSNQSTLNFKGFLEEEPAMISEDGALVMSSSTQQIKKAVNSGINELYVCVDTDKMGDLKDLISEGEKHCVRLNFVPNFTDYQHDFKFDTRGNFMVLSARNEPLESMHNRFKKRAFDVIVSSFVILFILSWLYPILAIIIKLQSPGPVIFKQQRSGRNNLPFWCYKFRSMRMNEDSGRRQAGKNDERVTPIGRFLRKSSLDEFPQFFNVLFGYMSLIGPRPHMLAHTEQYRAIIDKYMIRQFLKPGISGWAQVNGFRGETKETRLMEQRVEHDIWYMENWSLMLDIRIMFMTVINIFKGEEQAY